MFSSIYGSSFVLSCLRRVGGVNVVQSSRHMKTDLMKQ